MKAKLLHDAHGLRTYLVVLSTGEEAMAAITAFASEHRIGTSHFTGIGAFERAVVAYFDWPSRQYRNIAVDEQVELLSLAGDITLDQAKVKVHAHAVLGKADASAHGGHLVSGHVRPTLELVVTETPEHLRRRFDPASGLALR